MANARHKRDANARRTPPAIAIAGPLALLATTSAVALGVLASEPSSAPRDQVVAARADADLSAATERRETSVSRSAPRIGLKTATPKAAPTVKALPAPGSVAAIMAPGAVAKAVAGAHLQRWTTQTVNLWSTPGRAAEELGELEQDAKVLATGRAAKGREEIVVKGRSRWITAGYLTDEKPVAATGGLSMKPCPDGSVENGLTSEAVRVYRAVCNNFPQVQTYGGWDNHGEHSSGKAIDIMTSDVTLGTAIAEFLKTNAAALDLYDVIWRQRIFTQQRGGEGWRGMSDRGSATANHFDHVHVSTNG